MVKGSTLGLLAAGAIFVFFVLPRLNTGSFLPTQDNLTMPRFSIGINTNEFSTTELGGR